MSTVLESPTVAAYLPGQLRLVDTVRIEGDRITGYFRVSPQMPYFEHHFGAGKEIQPGILNTWAMAQVGALGILARDNKQVRLDYVQNVEFVAPVLPGDELRIEAELEGLKAVATGFVGDQKVVCGELGFREERCREAPEVKRFADTPPKVFSQADVRSLLPHGDGFRFIICGFAEVGKRASATFSHVDKYYYLAQDDRLELCPLIEVEAMAQAGAISLLSAPGNQGMVPVLTGIARADFYTPVQPGDGLRFEVNLGETTGTGIGFVNLKPVVSGEISFQLQESSRLERLLAIARKRRTKAA